MRANLLLSLIGSLILFPSVVPAQGAGRARGPGPLVEWAAPESFGRNVLILVADDLGVDSLAAYGEGIDLPPTPTLDELARTGVLFRNAWSQPTCSPTRATIHTGLGGYHTGIGTVIPTQERGHDLDLNLMTMPRMLDIATSNGYAHAAFGKWHVSNQGSGSHAPNLAGYEHFSGSMGGQVGDYFAYVKVVNGAEFPVFEYATSAVVDDSLEWIAKQTKPWLCYVAFQAPHAPFHRPPDHLHTQALPPDDPRKSCGDPHGSDPRPFFKAMVEAMDTEIGRLLDSLPEPLLANTTVIFLGDNGTDYCLGVPPFDGPAKSTLYEGGVNVPMIAWGAHVSGGESQALVQTTDLIATVAELAGVDLEEDLPGEHFESVSMVPYFQEPKLRSIRKTVFAEIFSPNGTSDFTEPTCVRDYCQMNVGFGTAGGPSFTSCGPQLFGLYTSHLVPLMLSGAPPGAQATLRIGSLAPTYDPNLGAEVVSAAPESFLNFTTNASGSINRTVFTGGLSDELYYQFVVTDPGSTTGFTVSNALRMNFLDTRMYTVRDRRFKLIHFSSCHQELYDLRSDPFERHNLLTLQADTTAVNKARELYRAAQGWRSRGF